MSGPALREAVYQSVLLPVRTRALPQLVTRRINLLRTGSQTTQNNGTISPSAAGARTCRAMGTLCLTRHMQQEH